MNWDRKLIAPQLLTYRWRYLGKGQIEAAPPQNAFDLTNVQHYIRKLDEVDNDFAEKNWSSSSS